jgi:hypothetical protein
MEVIKVFIIAMLFIAGLATASTAVNEVMGNRLKISSFKIVTSYMV